MMKLPSVLAVLAIGISGPLFANAVSNDVVLAVTAGQEVQPGSQSEAGEGGSMVTQQSSSEDWGQQQAALLASLSPVDTPVEPEATKSEAEVAVVKPIEPAFPFLRLRADLSPRTQLLSDGSVEFLVADGTLKENVRTLLAETQGAIPVMEGISDNHLVFSQYRLRGETVLDVLDKLVEPYSRSDQVVWQAHMNNAVILKYDRKQ